MHHYGTGAWLADVAMRGMLYSTIGRLMRSMPMPTMLLVCCIVLIMFIAYRSRRQ